MNTSLHMNYMIYMCAHCLCRPWSIYFEREVPNSRALLARDLHGTETMLFVALSAIAATLWRQTELPSTPAPSSLASMAERAANSLRSAEQRVCCFESTTGGLIQASLLASPGASKVRAATGLPTQPIPVPTLRAHLHLL